MPIGQYAIICHSVDAIDKLKNRYGADIVMNFLYGLVETYATPGEGVTNFFDDKESLTDEQRESKFLTAYARIRWDLPHPLLIGIVLGTSKEELENLKTSFLTDFEGSIDPPPMPDAESFFSDLFGEVYFFKKNKLTERMLASIDDLFAHKLRQMLKPI